MNTLCTRIFVDFWNLQLNLFEHQGRDYKLDWKALSPRLLSEAENILGAPLQFEGTHVYLSYDPHAPQDRGLHHWSLNVLDRFAGIHVKVKERKSKRPPTCPHCHQLIENCPHCGGQMTRTVEKGIDTAIVTDMISLAWENAWDVAILISSDRDFIPVVDFLSTKGRRVINVYFPPKGMHLARTCWGNIDLRPHLEYLAR